MDFELTVVERIILLEKSGVDEVLDVIQSVGGRYSFSGGRMYGEYLEGIVKDSNLNSVLKAEAVKSLFDFEEFLEVIGEGDDEIMKEIKRESNEMVVMRNKKRQDKAYETLSFLCERFDGSICTPYKVELISRLMVEKEDMYYEVCLASLKRLLGNLSLEESYRYGIILSLEKKVGLSKVRYQMDLLSYFVRLKGLGVRYVILGIQNLLGNFVVDVKSRMRYELMLLEIGEDRREEYNARADACDTLLNVGSMLEMKEKAKEILIKLGGGGVKTVYENAQNVHNGKIEESSLGVIRFLLGVSSSFDFVEVMKEIEEEMRGGGEEEKDKIRLSLNRLTLDRSYYQGTSLSTILVKLWSYIENKEDEEEKKEMKNRLREELVDMSGTCSSGFLLRLLNVLSGFEESAVLSISFEDQIVGNFVGRLNGYARGLCGDGGVFLSSKKFLEVLKLVGKEEEKKDTNLSDEKKREVLERFSEAVLNELCEDTSEWGKRSSFLLFFRTYLPVLREELSVEFKSYVTESELDLYLRKAISTYEGVKFLA